jgi:hypothetical protein
MIAQIARSTDRRPSGACFVIAREFTTPSSRVISNWRQEILRAVGAVSFTPPRHSPEASVARIGRRVARMRAPLADGGATTLQLCGVAPQRRCDAEQPCLHQRVPDPRDFRVEARATTGAPALQRIAPRRATRCAASGTRDSPHRCRDLFRRHQGRKVGVGARHHGEDRGVDHAQALDALDAALGIDHRHRIVTPAHPACA